MFYVCLIPRLKAMEAGNPAYPLQRGMGATPTQSLVEEVVAITAIMQISIVKNYHHLFRQRRIKLRSLYYLLAPLPPSPL